MTFRTIFITLILILSFQNLSAKSNAKISFLLKANDETSFMNYEFHNLAYEAAVKKDYRNSYRIYLKLANKGDDRAEYNIGMMYMNGLGTKRKKMDAYKWLRRASKHGNQEATLYFKQMNDRYAAKHDKKERKRKIKKDEPIVQETKLIEKNITQTEPETKPDTKPISTSTKYTQQEESSNLVYLISLGLLFIALIAFLLLRSSKGPKKEVKAKIKPDKPSQTSPVYKSQLYDITYAQISDYHNELLKYAPMEKFRNNKDKMQIYYMFLAGVIDYFCQLQKFNDIQQRRIFNTHMGEQEGKENLTAVTQAILEGQRDHSMYHFQAAGGISAQAWHENKSKDALSMLKKVLTEKHH